MKCKDIISLTEKDIRSTFDVNIVAHFWVNIVFSMFNSIHETFKENIYFLYIVEMRLVSTYGCYALTNFKILHGAHLCLTSLHG